MNLLGLAIAIAAEAFKDRKDKSGQPYILHCLWVMNHVETEDEKIVGVLHDLIEDTDWTIEKLRDLGFSWNVLTALDLLTHKDGDDYLDVYIKRIATNSIARKVKLRDLEHNSQITRLKGLRQKDFNRLEKYHRAYIYLQN